MGYFILWILPAIIVIVRNLMDDPKLAMYVFSRNPPMFIVFLAFCALLGPIYLLVITGGGKK